MTILQDFEVKRFETNLDNGVRVVLFRKIGAPVRTSAILKSGSRYDRENVQGTAHFLEHMITNGSERFPSKDLLAEHIESVGGFFGAWTNQEAMGVDTEISEKADYHRVVDIFEATLCKPLMDKKVFENEKQVVIKEIHKSNSSPQRLLVKTARQLFFGGTPFKCEVLGNEQSISSLVYDEIISEHKKLFDKSRITFIASGDISIEELTSHLNKLALLEGEGFELEAARFVTEKLNEVSATYFDTSQTHLYFGVASPELFSKDMLHLNLLGSILAGGRSARLTKRLRYEKGLIYSVHTARYGGYDVCSWGIATDTTDQAVQEVLDEIVKEVKDIRQNGVKESELEFVKNKRMKSIKRTMQTSEDWLSFHMTGEVFSPNKYMDIDMYMTKIRNTSIKDLELVIEKYLNPENWKLAMVGRTKDGAVKINW